MNRKTYHFDYDLYSDISELPGSDARLLESARVVTADAYAPYSHFHVGAAAMLTNGELVKGTNQENAAYPVGICAERVLLSAAASFFPDVPIHTIAISYHNLKGKSTIPVSPCGICRQSLLEYETRMQQPIRIILAGLEGEVLVVHTAADLLPLGFTATDMA